MTPAADTLPLRLPQGAPSPAVACALTVGTRGVFAPLPATLVERIERRLTFHNHEADRRAARGLPVWGAAEDVCVAERVGGGIAVPYGSIREVLDLLNASGLCPHVEDQTVAPSLAATLHATPRDYQARALAAVAGRRCGQIVAPTGSGKTVLIAGLVAQRLTTALVVTHTRPLLQQTVRELARLLDRPIGRLGDGAHDVQPVTVALVQTAVRHLPALRDIFGLLVVDEEHHIAAGSWRAVVGGVRARYRWGLTATPERKDGLSPVVAATIGPIRAQVERAEAAAHLAPVIVERLDTGRCYHVPADRSWTWRTLAASIARDEARNDLIASEVRQRLDDGPEDRVLVLTDRIAHADAIAHLLADREPVVLTGSLAGRARAAAMERVRAGARLTVGTVHLLGEGLDLPAWSVLVLAAPFAGGPRTAQAVGRVARPAPGKTRGLVLDLVDEHPALVGSWFARRKVYLRAGVQMERML